MKRGIQSRKGFTLIEVLLALAVIAIALTAILKATSQNTLFTNRIKEKTIGHWVAMQAIASINLGQVTLDVGRESTGSIKMLGQKWYWRGLLTPTALKHVQQITIHVSKSQDKGFSSPLVAFRYQYKNEN